MAKTIKMGDNFHYRYRLQNKEGDVLYETISYETTSRTPWIKNQKPFLVYLQTQEGNEYNFTLEDTVNKNNKRVLTHFGGVAGYNFRVVASYGTDDTRPSFGVTVGLAPRKEKRGRPGK